MDTVFGFFLALFVPLFFLSIIRRFDFYQSGQFHIIRGCLLWGAFIYIPAFFTNWTLEHFWLKNNGALVHFVAPIQEEIFKGLILLYFVRQAKFSYSVDGAIYGFAVGIGFAVVENFDYISTDMADVLFIAVQRIFSANLIHASSSAIVGISLGTRSLRRFNLHWLIFACGFVVAIGQHMLYNLISHNGTRSFIAAILTGILSVGVIIIVMKYSQMQAKNWIKEKLGMDDRVTRNEVTAVNHLTDPEDALYPVAERFGIEKARMVEKLLNLQARIGIKRKALDGFGKNDTIRNAVEAEIIQMRTDMKRVQHEIGIYAMIFVRGLFTEEMVSIWERVQAKIQERSAGKAVQKGGGLWSSLDKRVKSLPEDKGSDQQL